MNAPTHTAPDAGASLPCDVAIVGAGPAGLMAAEVLAQAGVAVHNVRMHEEAQRLSLTDPLTGLWNYRYLRESLRREVERASRFGRMLAVLVLDLDHFKEVNDTYGHPAGDVVATAS